MKQNAKSAIFTCENGKRLLRQLLLLLPAWIVLALGIAMCVFSGVGSDTNTSFQQGLGRMLGLQTGTVTLIFNCTVLWGRFFRPCRRCGHASPFAPSVL